MIIPKFVHSYIRTFVALFLVSCFLFLPVFPAHAQSNAQLGWLINSRCVGNTDLAKDVPTLGGLECLFGNALSVILALLGLATFIMILVSGFSYLTAGEDAKKAEAAKNTLTLAIGGLAAALISWFILLFIANFTGNTNLLQFKVDQGTSTEN